MSITRKTKNIGYVSALSAALFASAATSGTIEGSKHDFSNRTWSGGEICIVCHTPHNARDVADAPLWNHDLTTATFDTYISPTFDGESTIGQPDGSSLLCLSCHDGTVALDSFGGTTGTTFIQDRANLGTDLTNDHPISFLYDTDLVALDPGLHDPTTVTTTIGSGDKIKEGTIDQVMLFNGKLQCASCHDVHNTFTDSERFLLKITTDASELCLTCHDK